MSDKDYRRLRAVIALCLSLAAMMVFSGSYQFELPVSFFINIDGNIPEDMAFADILLKMDESDEWYTERNELTADLIPADSKLEEYCQDGYRSMGAHFRGCEIVGTDRKNNQKFCVKLSRDYRAGKRRARETYEYFCRSYKSFRIALADSDGNILSISDDAALTRVGVHPINPHIDYDADNYTVQTHFIPAGVVNGLLAMSGVFLPVTLIAAAILAVVFARHLDKYGTPAKRHIIEAGLLNIPWIATAFISLLHAAGERQELYDIIRVGCGWAAIVFFFTGQFVILIEFILFININKMNKKIKKEV